jgi:PAS domain S-box-containing protein
MTADNEDSQLRSVARQNAESIRAVRLRAEQKAETTLREQANLLNLTHDAIYVRDMKGTVKYWNRGAEEMYGWSAERALGRGSQELLKTILPVPFEQLEEEIINAGRWEGELVQTRKDGSQVVVASRWSLQRDEKNAPVAILVINNDITKRKRAEETARRSEKELRDVVNAVPAFVWSTLPDGAVDFVNERWLEFTGLAPQDARGWNWEAVVHPDDRSRLVTDWRAALNNGQPVEIEARVRRADGEFRWWFLRSVPLHDEAGNIVKWYGTGLDIEDRRREESLFAGEKRILEMVATGRSLAEILDHICRLVEEQPNGVLASILLLDGDRLRHGGAPSLPRAYTDAINGLVIGPSEGSCGTAAYRREQVIVEDIATDPLWANYRDLALPHCLRACWSTPIFSSQGKVMATFAMYYREPRRPNERDQGIINQIAHLAGVAIQHKLSQEKLQRSEAYLAEAQKLTQTGSWALEPRGEWVLHCSEEMFRLYGLDPGESSPTREHFRQRVHPEDRDRVTEQIDKTLRDKVGSSFGEYRIVLPDGSIRHINTSGHPVVDEHGELVEWVGTAMDITERKSAELERRRLASLVEQAADLMAIADLNGGTPIYLNKAGLKMVGFDSWEEARARRGIHYMFPEDRQFVNDVLWPTVLEKGSWSGEMRFRHFKTGEPIPVLYTAFRIDDPETGQPVNVGNVCRDITQRKRAEAEARENDRRYRDMQMELAHANRVATMGQLTASIAHEVNQPIAATVTNAEAALRWLRAGPPNLEEVQQALTNIAKDGSRAGQVISRIRGLINKAPPPKDHLEINGVIREIIELTRGESAKNGVSVSADLADHLALVEADRVQLQQVLLNLIINALDAMGAANQGPRELLIRTEAVDSSGVLVAVQDSGPGLEAALLERVFESFYSTKPTGLGLGLSICRSIIEAHGGRLWASKNQRRGATFQFTLPADANRPS